MATAKQEPQGYNTLQPYLHIRNCGAAMEFYKNVFGATERMRMTRADGRVMHGEIQLGDTCVMMADEHPEIGAYAPEHFGGAPMTLHLYVADCDATYQKALAAGAKSHREPADQDYGDRNGAILDPFGFIWWLATPKKA